MILIHLVFGSITEPSCVWKYNRYIRHLVGKNWLWIYIWHFFFLGPIQPCSFQTMITFLTYVFFMHFSHNVVNCYELTFPEYESDWYNNRFLMIFKLWKMAKNCVENLTFGQGGHSDSCHSHFHHLLHWMPVQILKMNSSTQCPLYFYSKKQSGLH